MENTKNRPRTEDEIIDAQNSHLDKQVILLLIASILIALSGVCLVMDTILRIIIQ